MNPRSRSAIIGAALLATIVFVPQLLLAIYFSPSIYDHLESVPAMEYGIVLGAYVAGDGTLSDAAFERVEAAVQLYHLGKIQRLFISGDNQSADQARIIAQYAQHRGVGEGDIIVDGLGIDTHDTCRHFATVASEGMLITQGYHLPRTMLMCQSDDVETVGIAVNHLGLLERRGENALAVTGTRLARLVRESVLSWLFILGIYDRISDDAETIEQAWPAKPMGVSKSPQPSRMVSYTLNRTVTISPSCIT